MTPSWPSPTLPLPDPHVVEQLDHRTNEKRRARSGALFLGTSSAFHLLSIPVVLLLTKVLVEFMARRAVTWNELFRALAATGGMPTFWFGIFFQFALAAGATFGAVLLRDKPSRIAYAMIVLGAVGVLFSLAFYGGFGFMGVFGGVLAIVGGVTARPKRPSSAERRLPPPLPRLSPPTGPPETP